MGYIKKIFNNADKKHTANIAVCLVVGIALLILGNTIFDSRENNNNTIVPFDTERYITTPLETDYVRDLENRLARILSYADGAGRVEVMIKMAVGREIIVAQDIRTDSSVTNEVDSAGGNRQTTTERLEETHIIMSDSGGQRPLVLREIEPRIEGVVIVAEGGGDIFVQDALIRAARTVLGVEPHKVQVLRMRPPVE